MIWFTLYVLVAFAMYSYQYNYYCKTKGALTKSTIKYLDIGHLSSEEIDKIKYQIFRGASLIAGILWPVYIPYTLIVSMVNLFILFSKKQ